jgi:hypothetical protein
MVLVYMFDHHSSSTCERGSGLVVRTAWRI